jgi:hypothetical protein
MLTKEQMARIVNEKKENDMIREWIDKRELNELKDLAFATVKLALKHGLNFENIGKELLFAKESMKKAKEALKSS